MNPRDSSEPLRFSLAALFAGSFVLATSYAGWVNFRLGGAFAGFVAALYLYIGIRQILQVVQRRDRFPRLGMFVGVTCLLLSASYYGVIFYCLVHFYRNYGPNWWDSIRSGVFGI